MKARVVIPVNAVKRTGNGTGVLKRNLKANSIIEGKFVKHGALPENSVVLFMTRDGFLVPTHCIIAPLVIYFVSVLVPFIIPLMSKIPLSFISFSFSLSI